MNPSSILSSFTFLDLFHEMVVMITGPVNEAVKSDEMNVVLDGRLPPKSNSEKKP